MARENKESGHSVQLPAEQALAAISTGLDRGVAQGTLCEPLRQPLDPTGVYSASYPMNGLARQRWLVLNDAQKRGCRSRRASPALLPLRPRKAGSFANAPDA